jgi:hypothetical protein
MHAPLQRDEDFQARLAQCRTASLVSPAAELPASSDSDSLELATSIAIEWLSAIAYKELYWFGEDCIFI